MNTLPDQIRKKKAETTSAKELFKNEHGAIDLASIMVGIIVIGLVGGVIASTVFVVIPWTQDNAARQQLDSIVAAESAYMGLSSTNPPSLPVGFSANSYGSSDELKTVGLLTTGDRYCVSTLATSGKGYEAFSQSTSGNIWSSTDKNSKPVIFTGTLPTDCQFITEGASSPESTPSPTPSPSEPPAITYTQVASQNFEVDYSGFGKGRTDTTLNRYDTTPHRISGYSLIATTTNAGALRIPYFGSYTPGVTYKATVKARILANGVTQSIKAYTAAGADGNVFSSNTMTKDAVSNKTETLTLIFVPTTSNFSVTIEATPTILTDKPMIIIDDFVLEKGIN